MVATIPPTQGCFEHYKKLETLQHYVLVSHTSRCVDVWTRGAGDTWTCSTGREGDMAKLPAIGASIDVRELGSDHFNRRDRVQTAKRLTRKLQQLGDAVDLRPQAEVSS